MARRIRFVLALFAVVGVLTNVAAACTMAASTADDEMACCKAGHMDCASHGTPDDCCTTSSHASAPFTAVAEAAASHYDVIPVPMLGAASIVSIDSGWHPVAAPDASSPPGSKHPTYLVLSTFRI